LKKVNPITSYSVLVALVLAILLIFIFIIQKSHMSNYSQELKQTVLEAGFIRDELEKMMENSLSISELILGRLDTEASSVNYSSSREDDLLAIQEMEEETISPHLPPGEEQGSATKVRLYELARELEMSSKDLIQLLNDKGYTYSHHMNQISQETAEIIKDKVLRRDDPISLPDSFMEKALLFEEETTTREELPWLEFSLDELRTAHPYLAVRSLHEKGYNIKEIAQLLERGQGEVELILNLTRKKSVM
jgi:transposase